MTVPFVHALSSAADWVRDNTGPRGSVVGWPHNGNQDPNNNGETAYPIPNLFSPTSPPKGGGLVAPKNLFTPSAKVTLKQTGKVKPVPHKSVEKQAQEFAMAKQVGHGIVNPEASAAAARAHVISQPQVTSIPTYTDTQRFKPHYPDEPIAGYVGEQGGLSTVLTPGAPLGDRKPLVPYYTDAYTATKNAHAAAAAAPLGGDIPGSPYVAGEFTPTGQKILQGIADTVPGVATAKAIDSGTLGWGTLGKEAINTAGVLGPAAILDPIRAARIAAATKAGGASALDSWRAARASVGAARAARSEAPIVNANLQGSESRQAYIKTMQDAGYTKREQQSHLALADQVALAHSTQAGVTPEQAWNKIYADSKYKNIFMTPEQLASHPSPAHAFAQEGEKPELHNLAATPSEHVPLPDTQSFFKRQSANFVRKFRPQLPAAHATPKKLEGLLHELRGRAVEASAYKDWYERSGHAILQHVNNDVPEADKLAALIAVYSPQAAVYSKTTEWNNLDRAVKAYDSYRTTGEIPSSLSISKTLKRDWQTEVAAQIMQGHFEWNGLKINRFYRNFLQHIDPTKYEALFGTEKFGTIDSWMQKAYHYATERYTSGRHLGDLKSIQAPNKKTYAFMEQVNKVVADSLGWSPEEAQAAIWTSIKAEEEGTPLADAGFHFGDAFAHRGAREYAKTFAERTSAEGAAAINAAYSENTRAWNLTPHSPEELAGSKVFTSGDGKAGYVISPEGDLQNVFNNSGHKGILESVLTNAEAHGATTLDAYDGFLPKYYERHGFRETGRMKFEPEYAPPNMPADEIAKAPDVVFMARTDALPEGATSRYFTSWDEAKQASADYGARHQAGIQFEKALAEAAGMAGKKVPKSGIIGNMRDRRETLQWLSHAVRYNTDPEVSRVAETLDQAIEAGNSPNPEQFFQTDNPLLNIIAAAHDKVLTKMKTGPQTNEDLVRIAEDPLTGDQLPRGGPKNNGDLQRLAGEPVGGETPSGQIIKGMFERTSTGHNFLTLFQGNDATTLVHELGHAIETLMPAATRDALTAAGIQTEEDFARAFERFVYNGKTANEHLRGPLRDIAVEMSKVYRRAEDIPGSTFDPEIRTLFDSFFTRESGRDPEFAKSVGASWFAQEGNPPDHALEEGDAAPNLNEGRPVPGELIGGTPEQQLVHGLRGARLRYNLQKKARSEELTNRSKKVAEALATISNPDEAAAVAYDAMRGELPKIDFNGLKVLDSGALRQLKEHVQHHEALLPFQKLRLMKTLDQAVNEGRVPTPAEAKLIAHVFGKQTARGIVGSTGTWGDKVINILNIPRTLQATADLSAALRQGLVAGASHPIMWGRAWPVMLRAFRDPAAYEKTMKGIEEETLYPLALAAHISFTDVGEGASILAHEEQFASDYATHIPGIGHLIKASARAYVAFLNKLRMDLFKHQIRVAMLSGQNVNDEKYLKSIGDVINAATGRGTIHGRAEHILPALNTLMFSPRLMLSRLNYLDPTWYVRLHPEARKEALRGLFATACAVTSIVYLASRIPGVKVGSLDPTSSDFGKLKIGNTRLDLAGGFQQYIHFAYVMASGEKTSSATGITTKLGSKYGAPTRFDEIVQFATSKAAPPISIASQILKGKDVAGNKVTPQGIAFNAFVPLVIQDARDLYNDRQGGVNGIMWAIGGYGLGAIGVSEQTYGPKDPAANPTKTLTAEAKQAGFGAVPKDILLDVNHKANLDAISRQHPKDDLGRLNAAIDYYGKTTGDHSFDSLKGSLPPDAARQVYDSIRSIMIGPGLASYEAAIKQVIAAEKAAA